MTELTTVLEDLLGDPQFLYALAIGAAIVAAFYVVSRILDRRPRGWALVYGVGILAILGLVFSLDPSLLLTLLLLLVAGALVDLAGLVGGGRSRLLTIGIAWSFLAVAILCFTARVTADQDLWLQLTLPIWIVAVLLGARSLDRSSLAMTAAPLLAVTVIGIWVTVPETDMVEAALGAVLPMAVVTLPPIRARATLAGLALMVGLLGWLIVEGATGRAIPIVGGFVSAGVVALAPLLGTRRFTRGGVPALAVHFLYVLIATRVVDWLESMAAVLIALGLLTVAAVVALLALSGPVDSRSESHKVGAERLI